MESSLVGRTALVTGAGRGIGKGIAEVLADNGANIVAADIDLGSVTALANDFAGKNQACLPVYINVTNAEAIAEAVAEGTREFGAIDILVNNAGVVRSALLIDFSEADWDLVNSVNLKGAWLCARSVMPSMIASRAGKIINIASQAGKTGEYGNGPYSISKAGVIMLTQVLALELGEYGINVNSIAPGYTDTELMEDVFQKRGPLEGMTPEQYEASLLAGVPLGRMASPREIGDLVAFLASERASYITGECVVIAGGKEMH